jgi:predicted MFS family arabinose efflux permease
VLPFVPVSASVGPGLRIVVLLSALTAVSQFYRASLSAIAPELSRDLALSPEALGMANGAFFLSLGLVQLPVGMLFDRHGPRRTIGALTVLAVAGSLLHAAATPLAAATTEVGWRWAFVGAAGFTVVVGLLFHALVGDAPPGVAAAGTRESMGAILRGLAQVWRSPGLPRVLAIHTFAYASMITILGLWAGPYLHDVHGLAPVARGNVLLAMGLAQIVGILAYGPLDRLFNTRKRVVMAGTAGSIALLGTLAALSQPPTWLAVLLLVAFCLVTAYGIVIVAHGRSLFPDELAGRGVTTVNLAQVAGSAGLPILTGALVGAFPMAGGVAPEAAYRAIWAFIAVALASGLVVYAGARDVPPRPAPSGVAW